MKERFSETTVKYVGMAELRRKRKMEKTTQEVCNNEANAEDFWTDRLLFNYLESIENRKDTVIIMDELEIYQSGKINLVGEPSFLNKVFQLLKEFKMSIAVLSSYSVLDMTTGMISSKELESFTQRNGFNYVELKNVMRTSQSIVNATSVPSLNRGLIVELKETISSGNVSTIIGTKPTCILFKEEQMENEYQTLARCIAQYLHKVDIDVSKTKLTVVVVCQWTLNPRLVKKELERG